LCGKPGLIKVSLTPFFVHSESPEPQAAQVLPFHPYAIQTTQFKDSTRPALLKDAAAQLEETLALFSPMAMAA
jgi:hypothetical protein